MAGNLTTRSGWCCLLLIAAAGCGGGKGPVPVRGIVKLDGKPLAGASVQFIAQDEGGRDSTGSTDADGVFRLSTFQSGDGALPGKYKVVVQLPAATQGGAPAATPTEAQQGSAPGQQEAKAPPTIIPPRYSQPDQTTLEQVVPPSGEIVFDLKSK
jgi:hypothetical protein